MSDDTSAELIQHGPFTFVPVAHGRLEFAVEAHRAFHQLAPDAVAVEFPPTLRPAIEAGLDRLPRVSVVLYQEKDGRHVYLPLEPQDAAVDIARLARATGTPLFFIDRDTEGYPRRPMPLPDPYAIQRLGLAAYVTAYAAEFGTPEPEERESGVPDQLREMTMAWHLQDLAKNYNRVLCVLGLAHYPGVRRLLDQPLTIPLGRTKRQGVVLANLDPDSFREIMTEMPFMAAAFVKWSQDDSQPRPDRLQLQRKLIDLAQARHLKNAKEEVNRAQLAVLFKFARNYALVQGHLTADLYQLLIAARGAVDDNFAYEVWDLATTYPWPEADPHGPTVRLTGEDLYLDTRKITFYRRFRQQRRRLLAVPVRKRKREKKPGEWRENWEGTRICSYPPEDIVVEGFGDYLKKKTVQILSQENKRVQPFQASLLDGIDLRETIRHWHDGRLYVTENRPVSGRVGSVVIIFDEDEPGDDGVERFPWRMTWLGEHAQESDMAFYASPAGEQVVGPGISRCEYGGFMLTYPPLRLADIWRDPFFDGTRTKAERLLLAGIDYSEQRLVAYIAARPPADRIKALAGYYGRKVVYLPLGQFSPVTLKKMRVFHVLDGHQARDWAPEYIY